MTDYRCISGRKSIGLAVVSESHEGEKHQVTVHGENLSVTCSCRGFAYRATCKHIGELATTCNWQSWASELSCDGLHCPVCGGELGVPFSRSQLREGEAMHKSSKSAKHEASAS